ncbi:MAG: DNA-binding protein [candidate division NC10 bacterium]
MDRVFLDANVLFSAAYRADSGLLVLRRRAGVAVLTSAYAVAEAQRNLARDDQRRRLDALVRRCQIVPTPAGAVLPEGLVLPPGHALIVLAAMAARATHLLTGDRTHFGPYYGQTIAGVLILPPSAYLQASA